jgi:hypothetical protein
VRGYPESALYHVAILRRVQQVEHCAKAFFHGNFSHFFDDLWSKDRMVIFKRQFNVTDRKCPRLDSIEQSIQYQLTIGGHCALESRIS